MISREEWGPDWGGGGGGEISEKPARGHITPIQPVQTAKCWW